MIAMRRIGLVAFLAASTFLAGVADARGYRRGRTVTTPDGSANMNSPEWKQSGGDFRVYRQLVQQKQMMLRRRAMMKQREAFLRQQKKGEQARPSSPGGARPAAAPKSRPTRKADPTSVPSSKTRESSKTTSP